MQTYLLQDLTTSLKQISLSYNKLSILQEKFKVEQVVNFTEYNLSFQRYQNSIIILNSDLNLKNNEEKNSTEQYLYDNEFLKIKITQSDYKTFSEKYKLKNYFYLQDVKISNLKVIPIFNVKGKFLKFGQKSKQTVKDLFSKSKIPLLLRSYLFALIQNDNLLYVQGLGSNMQLAVSEEQQEYIIELCVEFNILENLF